MSRFGVIALLLLVYPALLCSEVFKWTDEDGVVHFGDRVPEKYQQRADDVDVNENVNVMDPVRPPVLNTNTTKIDKEFIKKQIGFEKFKNSKRKGLGSDCKSQWERYRISKRCFDSCGVVLITGRKINSNCRCGGSIKRPSCEL